MKLNQFFQIAAVVFFSINFSSAQDFSADTYYRLTTKWQGEDKSLDIINDGKNITPTLAKTGQYSGQAWKITKVGADTYTLTTQWRGPEMKLDCIQGPNQNRPVLNKSKYSGSAWKITPIGDGYYKITNSWLSDRSLDIINDGKNNKIQVAKTGNYTGQMWKITDLNPKTKNHLNAEETLKGDKILVSENGKYMLRMQAEDGHLCVYKYANGKQGGFVWGSGKHGFKGSKLVMQGDGNLVVYDGKNDAKWSSQTHPYFDSKFRNSSNKPVKLVLENDGSLQLYTASGSVVWSNKKRNATKSARY